MKRCQMVVLLQCLGAAAVHLVAVTCLRPSRDVPFVAVIFDVEYTYLKWNILLVASTLGFSIFSFTPYAFAILHGNTVSKPIPIWVYPLLRIIGSSISVILVQFIIQFKILSILPQKYDPNSQKRDPKKYDVGQILRVLPLQAALFFAIMCTCVGYVGCFTIVQQASPNDTYIWLALEAVLSLIRLFIWSVDPKSDESTSLTLNIHESGVSPLVTTEQNLPTLTQPGKQAESFMALSDWHFLDHISRYTGPVEKFSDPGNHLAVYYTLAGDQKAGKKVLLTTVLDLESRDAFVLHHTGESEISQKYTATFKTLEGIGVTKVTGVLKADHEFTQTPHFKDIQKHSMHLLAVISGIHRDLKVSLSWGLRLKDPKTPYFEKCTAALTAHDQHLMHQATELYPQSQMDRETYLKQSSRYLAERPVAFRDFDGADILTSWAQFSLMCIGLEQLMEQERTAVYMRPGEFVLWQTAHVYRENGT
ncbi:hypothetical protein B0H11DRAFT_1927100 [Mycena galericulata]|nr:hypothetical protein B0H11DRAFT_1927100 [Mycena galericulata]